MISVERQLPRNSRIIADVSAAAIRPSRATPLTAPLTNTDWSPITTSLSDGGRVASMRGNCALTPEMMSSVDAEPLFSTLISTARRPSTRTMLPLRRITVAHVRDVAHEDHRAVHAPDRQRIELVDGQRAVVEPDVVLEAADLLRAGRDDLVLLRQRGRDILRGQPLGLQRLRIEIDLHPAHLAAVWRRNRDPATDSNCGRITLVA